MKTEGDDNSRMTTPNPNPTLAPTSTSPSTVPPETSASIPSGVAALPHLGIIKVAGDDAASFLQGQLTQDFALLGPGEARLAAFCSAKGRMQASFVGFKKSPTEILLICSRDLLAQTLKRLSMFVMRAKAKLTDATDEFSLRGLTGDVARQFAGNNAAPWIHIQSSGADIVTLYPAVIGSESIPRALWIAPVIDAEPEGAPLPADLWMWGEVRSGVAYITQPVFEAYVPQMLNLESVDGVNFKKGCYPGQEVVARSQFRGTLKRRAYIGHVDAESAEQLAVGAEVFDMADVAEGTAAADIQPTGTVVLSAPAPTGGFDIIVSMQISSAESTQLKVGDDRLSLTLLPLPYPLRDDI